MSISRPTDQGEIVLDRPQNVSEQTTSAECATTTGPNPSPAEATFVAHADAQRPEPDDGTSVEYLPDGGCLVQVDGCEVEDITGRWIDNLANGYGGVLTGRVDPGRPNLPPHKTPWHRGVTGYRGRDSEPRDIPALIENVARRMAFGHERGLLNLGARVPTTLVGLDVDAYAPKRGAATLTEQEDRLGPLPSTWVITARCYDTGSGIRLYRVPEGWTGAGMLPSADGTAGDVELIQRHHRFITAPGSLHHTGATYRLYHQSTDDKPRGDVLPADADTPALPDAWLTGLYRKPRMRGAAATTDEMVAFAEECTFDTHPHMLDKTVSDVIDASAVGATRNPAHQALWIAARKARAGCYPWARALGQIEAAARDGYAARGKPFDEFEFSRSVEHAITEALDMTDAECTRWAGDYMGEPVLWRYRQAYRRAYRPLYRPIGPRR